MGLVKAGRHWLIGILAGAGMFALLSLAFSFVADSSHIPVLPELPRASPPGARVVIPRPTSPAAVLTPRHFPLAEGYEWVYMEEGESTRTKVMPKVRIAGLDCFGLRMETPGLSMTDYYRVDDRGVWHHRSASPFPQVGNLEFERPILRIKFGAGAGETWEWRETILGRPLSHSYANEGAEVIQSPAGAFKTVKVSGKVILPESRMKVVLWLAPDVGVVKARQTIWSGETLVFDAQKLLLRFDRGK